MGFAEQLLNATLTTGLKIAGIKPEERIGDVGQKEQPVADVGIPQTQQQVESVTPVYSGYTGSGYSGYSRSGGGGSGSSTTPADQQKKQQASINNMGDIYNTRAGDVAKNAQREADKFTKASNKRQKEMSKNAIKQLSNINQSIAANDALLKTNQANIMKQVSWQPNQQKEQSMLMAMRNRMGNAAYGSGLVDLAEGLQRVDDMNDTELINAWKQNEDAAYSNWFQANEALINDYNDQIASIGEQFSDFAYQYANEMNDYQTKYNDTISQLQSQYWQAMNTANPELATKKNIKAAAKNAKGTSKISKAVTKAQNKVKIAQDAAKLANKMAKGKDAVDTSKLAKGNKTQRKAAEILVDSMHNKAETKSSEKLQKIVKQAAKNAVSQAKKGVTKAKEADRISVGEGTDQYYLPNVDLNRKVNFNTQLNGPSEALQKMMVAKESADSQNPNTAAYIRPDRASALGGTIDTSRAANQGFNDNLAAFRR